MRLETYAVLLAVAASLGGVGYWYVKHLESKINTLTETNAVLKQQVDIEKKNTDLAIGMISAANARLEQFSRSIEDLRSQGERAAEDRKRLDEIFAKHDVAKISKKRPTLLQRRINAASRRASGLLECASRVSDETCDDKPRKAGGSATSGSKPNSTSRSEVHSSE